MAKGPDQLPALHMKNVVGYVERAKEEYFETGEVPEEEYSKVFQSLDKIHQYAEQFLSELERKHLDEIPDFEEYPEPNGKLDNLAGYLQDIRDEAVLASTHIEMIYDEQQESLEEGLIEEIRDEIKRVSDEIYGSPEEFDEVEIKY